MDVVGIEPHLEGWALPSNTLGLVYRLTSETPWSRSQTTAISRYQNKASQISFLVSQCA